MGKFPVPITVAKENAGLNLQTLQAAITERRCQVGLTPGQLAVHMGFPLRNILAIEQGNGDVDVLDFFAVAIALGISLTLESTLPPRPKVAYWGGGSIIFSR